MECPLSPWELDLERAHPLISSWIWISLWKKELLGTAGLGKRGKNLLEFHLDLGKEESWWLESPFPLKHFQELGWIFQAEGILWDRECDGSGNGWSRILGFFSPGCFTSAPSQPIQVWNSSMDWLGSCLDPCDPENPPQALHSQLIPGSAPSGIAGEGKLWEGGAGAPCQGMESSWELAKDFFSCFSLWL